MVTYLTVWLLNHVSIFLLQIIQKKSFVVLVFKFLHNNFVQRRMYSKTLVWGRIDM